VTTPPPIDPFTPELLVRLAQGAFRPPSPMPAPGLMQPPPERPSGHAQLAGMMARLTLPPPKKDPGGQEVRGLPGRPAGGPVARAVAAADGRIVTWTPP